MPGRIRLEDLNRKTRAKIADRVGRPAPAATRSARVCVCDFPDGTPHRPADHRWFCLTCGLRTPSEAAMLVHCDTERHYRYTDLGLGL